MGLIKCIHACIKHTEVGMKYGSHSLCVVCVVYHNHVVVWTLLVYYNKSSLMMLLMIQIDIDIIYIPIVIM